MGNPIRRIIFCDNPWRTRTAVLHVLVPVSKGPDDAAASRFPRNAPIMRSICFFSSFSELGVYCVVISPLSYLNVMVRVWSGHLRAFFLLLEGSGRLTTVLRIVSERRVSLLLLLRLLEDIKLWCTRCGIKPRKRGRSAIRVILALPLVGHFNSFFVLSRVPYSDWSNPDRLLWK